MANRRKTKAERLSAAASVSSMASRWYGESSASHSEQTLRNRENALRIFAHFLEEAKGVTYRSFSWECFCSDNLKEWRNWLVETRGCKPQSVNVYMSSLRAFLEFASAEDITLVGLYTNAERIRKMKAVPPPVEGLTKAAEEAVMEESMHSGRQARRNHLLCRFMTDTGARIHETLSLRLRDLHLDHKDPYVVVTGKGSKKRKLYLGEELTGMLKEQVRLTHGENRDGDLYLFPGSSQRPYVPLSERAVQKMVAEIGKRARKKCSEVPQNLHPHIFRHTRGTRLAQAGTPLPVIQSILGHASPNTTSVYITITDQMMHAAQMALENESQQAVQPQFRDDKTLMDIFKRFKR